MSPLRERAALRLRCPRLARTYYLGTGALKGPLGPTIWVLGGLGRYLVARTLVQKSIVKKIFELQFLKSYVSGPFGITKLKTDLGWNLEGPE